MTTTDPRAWLAEVQERASKATPGPWEHQPWGGQNQNGDYAGGEVFAVGDYLIHDISDEDGEFIAHARTDLPPMATALTEVLKLHTMDPFRYSTGHICDHCEFPYPCPTVRTITYQLSRS